MPIVRKEQMQVFEARAYSSYVDELVAHCNAFAPRLCKVAGDDAVRATVRNGLRRAEKAGWNERRLAPLYIELMLLLGSSFDTDPQYPRMQPYLGPSEIENAHTRACHLFEELTDYRNAVFGPSDAFVSAALRRFEQWEGEELRCPIADVGESLFAVARRLYPEKADYLGPALISSITSVASKEAAGLGLPADGAVPVLSGLMFVFGAGVCTDPLYPWVSRVLRDPLITTPAGRVQRLLQKAKRYAGHAAEYLAGS